MAEFMVLSWPLISSDLSLVEHLWMYLMNQSDLWRPHIVPYIYINLFNSVYVDAEGHFEETLYIRSAENEFTALGNSTRPAVEIESLCKQLVKS